MRRSFCTVLIVLCVAHAFAACSAAPRQRPLQTSPIEEGPNTVSAVRKQLEGTWTLTSLNVSTADGKQAAVDATGTLTADGFGVLFMEFRMSDAGQKAMADVGIKSPNPVISTTGRVVIDPQSRQMNYVSDDFQTKALGFDPDLAARRANPFALERARYYVLAPDGTLTLSTRHDNGREASVSKWKKAS